MEQSAREFEGEDLEEALRAAAAALGAAVDTLDFEIVEEGRRGVFGLGARRVRISVESPAGQSVEPAPVVLAATEAERVSDPDARMVAIEHILRLMRLDLTARTIGRREDGIRIELTGRDRNALTRNEGELLSALQFVLNRMGRRAWPQAGHTVEFDDRRCSADPVHDYVVAENSHNAFIYAGWIAERGVPVGALAVVRLAKCR
jgi:predicted RNA-binding protein Jag